MRGRGMVGVGGRAVAQNIAKGGCAALSGALRAFQHHEGRALAQVQAGAVLVKGAAGTFRAQLQAAKAPVGHFRKGVGPAGQNAIRKAAPDQLPGQADGVGPGGAGVGDGPGRAGNAELLGQGLGRERVKVPVQHGRVRAQAFFPVTVQGQKIGRCAHAGAHNDRLRRGRVQAGLFQGLAGGLAGQNQRARLGALAGRGQGDGKDRMARLIGKAFRQGRRQRGGVQAGENLVKVAPGRAQTAQAGDGHANRRGGSDGRGGNGGRGGPGSGHIVTRAHGRPGGCRYSPPERPPRQKPGALPRRPAWLCRSCA